MRSCGCDCPDHGFLRGRSTPLRHPTDPPIDATLEDLWSIREQLKIIERLLERITKLEERERFADALELARRACALEPDEPSLWEARG